MRLRDGFIAILVACVIAGSTVAQQPQRSEPPKVTEHPRGPGDAKGGNAKGWNELGPRERYRALKNYHHHQQLPQEHRETVERNYERWQAMPEHERNRIRKNYEKFRRLPPAQRERLRQQPPPPPAK
ncbi:MAG: DUF3106 domain-containing protein [Deltaproteobacteria bacterium]|nr:DUF3106 domain-containing protein [Deltaproteobacteria bacterium]MBI3386265.1 DUF3106 domain-containing protein [Deltaproteobacteria bacterium]